MDIVLGVAAVSSATCIVVATRAFRAVRLAAIRASVAKNAQEYAMLEKMSERPGRIPKKKRSKTPAPTPFGL